MFRSQILTDPNFAATLLEDVLHHPWLGRQRLGTFTWLALLDQKVSTWTPLVGILFFGLAAALYDPVFLLVYLTWVALTHSLHGALLGLIARRWHPVFPALIYFGQVVGAGIEIFTSHHPNVQRWTRQNTGGARVDAAALPRPDSQILLVASLVGFAALITLFSGVISGSDRFDMRADTAALELIHGH